MQPAAASLAEQTRGERLATMMCAGCHFNSQDQALSGAHVGSLPKYMGSIYSANITQDVTGLKHYSRQALAHLIDFLQSDHPLVLPVRRVSGKSCLSWRSRLYLLFRPPKAKIGDYQHIDLQNSSGVEHGEYLVAILECYACHSRSTAGLNRQFPEKTPGFMAGGMKLSGAGGRAIYGANLTPDGQTGIGNWTAT
ncbi:MAG: hypothetical protein HKN85_10925 [Gammaproteobacteria bacterium]|nr:hypothetical protein [Gammaproteobacteria bacterium]